MVGMPDGGEGTVAGAGELAMGMTNRRNGGLSRKGGRKNWGWGGYRGGYGSNVANLNFLVLFAPQT